MLAILQTMKKVITVVLTSIFFMVNALHAQTENVDFMRSIGKIYVVVAVIVAIFVCLVLYLFYLDRKLTRLENQINNK